MFNILRQQSGIICNSPNVQDEWAFGPLKVRTICCLELVGTNHPVTWWHIPEEQAPRVFVFAAVLLYRLFMSSVQILL
jgi:hypothetical protein